ncbi:MAG: FAD-binding oxidoreductase, partial [Acidimicrobiales bacterium]
MRRARRRRQLSSLARDLVAALAPDRVRDDSASRALHAHDSSVFGGGVSGPVCYPVSTAEVQAIMRISAAHGRGVVPRGAGSGLAGGAIPLGAPVVVALTRMNRILEVDVDSAAAWVEPGVVNLDLTRHLRPLGYHFAPDPSS